LIVGRREKLLFTGKEPNVGLGVSLLPNPHPFSRKAEYFAAPLSRLRV